MKFWCVNQKFFDDGKIEVCIYSVKAERKPKDDMRENNLCDEYCDYFDSYSDAKGFASLVKNA